MKGDDEHPAYTPVMETRLSEHLRSDVGGPRLRLTLQVVVRR